MPGKTPVALVSGAGRGIGRSIAVAFAAQGYSVAVNDIEQVGYEETVAEITSNGGNAEGFIADVGDEASVQVMLNDVRDSLGPVSVLVNNAAYYEFVNPTEQSAESFARTFQVDVLGAFLATRAVVGQMASVGGGVVINISSLNGYVTIPQNAAYSAAKAALIGLTRAFALELGPRHIRVVSISPGFTATPAVELYLDALDDDARQSEMGEYYSRIPLGRLGRPEEIADACVFLASERASFITGTDLLVDGGMFALNRAFSYNP